MYNINKLLGDLEGQQESSFFPTYISISVVFFYLSAQQYPQLLSVLFLFRCISRGIVKSQFIYFGIIIALHGHNIINNLIPPQTKRRKWSNPPKTGWSRLHLLARSMFSGIFFPCWTAYGPFFFFLVSATLLGSG